MQIVGRECDLCGARLKSEVGAIACERCEIAFHTTCLKTGGPTTYREGAARKTKRAASLCPTCGDDLRALAREREAAREASHDAAMLRRDVEAKRRTQRDNVVRVAVAILLSVAFTILRVVLTDQ